MALEVDIALNAREFQATTKNVERDLKDLGDVLEDFGSEADDAGQKGEDALDTMRDAAKDAERKFRDLTDETEKTRRELGKAEDAADDLGRAAKNAGDDGARGMDKAKEGVEEFRDEANSTARESAASFDGSAESIADAFQEIAANAFAGFGPAGAVAGLAAAAGIGLAVAGFDAMNEAEQASRERATEWAQVWIDNGQRVLTAASLQAQISEIVNDTERWAQVQQIASAAGVDQSLALRALAGDAQAYVQVQAELSQAEEANTAAIAATGDELTAMAQGLYSTRSEIGSATNALNENNDAMSQGQAIADVYAQSVLDTAIAAGQATESTNQFGDAVYALPDGSTVTVDAETGQATLDLDGVENQVNTLPDGTVQVNVAPVNDYNLQNFLARRHSITVQVNARTRLGVDIPV